MLMYQDYNSVKANHFQHAFFMPNQLHSFTVPKDALLWVCVFSGDLIETFCKETENRRYKCPIFHPSETLAKTFPNMPDMKFESPYLLQSFLYRLCHEFYCQNSVFVSVPNTDSSSIHKIICYITQL